MAETVRPERRPLAEKLNRLFRTMHPAGRGEYSVEEIVEIIRERGGLTISPAYLYQLRSGHRDNPTKQHLEALADAFGVSPAYFFDDALTERIEAELDLLAALRDGPVRHLALRAFGLSPGILRAITDMVEEVRQLEGGPDPDAPRPRRGRPPLRAAGPAQPATAEDDVHA